jgi:hypothetical protein
MRILVDTVCPACQVRQVDVFVDRDAPYPPCACGGQTERLWTFGTAIRGDEIPGGLVIEHGLCHEDGTPRTYHSWSEINRECKRRGMVRWTDVYTEDKTKDARVRADWLQSSEATRAKALRDEARREGVRR